MLKSYFYCSIIPLGLDLTICFKNNKSNDNKGKALTPHNERQLKLNMRETNYQYICAFKCIQAS